MIIVIFMVINDILEENSYIIGFGCLFLLFNFFPTVNVLVNLATTTSVELSHSALSQRIIVSFVLLIWLKESCLGKASLDRLVSGCLFQDLLNLNWWLYSGQFPTTLTLTTLNLWSAILIFDRFVLDAPFFLTMTDVTSYDVFLNANEGY